MKNVLLAVTVGLLFLSCRNNVSTHEDTELLNGLTNTSIGLEEISDSKCLNFEKFFNALHQLYPDPVMRSLTTEINLISEKPIPVNYLLRLAKGYFTFEFTDRNSFTDLSSVVQSECHSITLNELEDYRIIDSSKTKLVFEIEKNEIYTFEWISPQQIKLAKQFIPIDYLCGKNLSLKLSVHKYISWQPQELSSSLLNQNVLSKSFLQLVSEASDYPFEQLIASDYYLTSELKNLSDKSINPDYLNCKDPIQDEVDEEDTAVPEILKNERFH